MTKLTKGWYLIDNFLPQEVNESKYLSYLLKERCNLTPIVFTIDSGINKESAAAENILHIYFTH